MFRRRAEDSAVTLAQSAMCCARVKDLLERSVRDLQQYQASHDFPEISSSLSHASDVCVALEGVFLHNFRAPFTAKMSSSLARLGRRQSQDHLPEISFWPFVALYTPRDFVEQIFCLQQISTEVGQCRAWIRLALNHSLILSYVEAMLADKTVLTSWYSEGAFLLDESCATLLCSLVRGLSICDFKLMYDCSTLNTWTRQVLQMVGIYQSYSGGSATSSSGAASAMTETGNDDGPAVIRRSKSESAKRHKSRHISADNTVIRELHSTPVMEVADSPGSGSGAGDVGVVAAAVGTSPRGDVDRRASLPSSFADSSAMVSRMGAFAESQAASGAVETPPAAASPAVSLGEEPMSGMHRHQPVSSPPTNSNGYSFRPGTSFKGGGLATAAMSGVTECRVESVAMPSTARQSIGGHAHGRPAAHGEVPSSPPGTHASPVTTSASSSAMPSTSVSSSAGTRQSQPQPVAPASSSQQQPQPSQDKPSKLSRALRKKKKKKEKGKERDSGKSRRSKVKAELTGTMTKTAAGLGYDVVNDDLGSHQPVSRDDKLEDGRLGLILKISNEHGLESQTYQCHSCTRPIGVLFGPAKVCSYDGRYYCAECHLDEEELIPARLVHNWDFHKYKVCKDNLEVLHVMEEQPIIDLASTNPSLYTHISELQEAKLLRSQLKACYTYVSTCKDPKILEEFQKRLPREHLVQCNEHIYSVQDLIQVQSGVLVPSLKKLLAFASKHIHECEVCRMKGFICEICKDEDVIFAFDVASCTQCARCLAVFHRTCKAKVPCPKCQRLAARQQRLMSQSDGSDG
eukprot:scpid30216/ scgid29869/ Pleckstrin homology domain-containing family M member 3